MTKKCSRYNLKNRKVLFKEYINVLNAFYEVATAQNDVLAISSFKSVRIATLITKIEVYLEKYPYGYCDPKIFTSFKAAVDLAKLSMPLFKDPTGTKDMVVTTQDLVNIHLDYVGKTLVDYLVSKYD